MNSLEPPPAVPEPEAPWQAAVRRAASVVRLAVEPRRPSQFPMTARRMARALAAAEPRAVRPAPSELDEVSAAPKQAA